MSDFTWTMLWYVVVQAFGLAALPISLRLFRNLPDRGYGLSKPMGMLLAGWVFWILNTFGWLPNTAGGVLAAIGAILVAGLLVGPGRGARRHRPGGAACPALTAPPARVVIATEIVFGVAFIAWVLVRASMPRIETAGGEKWMEIAFLRAILRSGSFPPHDPWLSGYSISYYYFGYVIVAMVTKLSGVPPSIAFNLGIATLFALGCCGAYSLVFNLLSLRGRGRAAHGQDAADRRTHQPLTGALLGPLLLAVMGNLEGLLEVLHARGVGSAAFWRWLDIRSLSEPPPSAAQGSWVPQRFFWWWQASRVVRDTAPWGDHWEVIDEFPAFSFILGDMHPHVLALPFVLLAVGLALSLYVRVSRRHRERRNPYALLAGWPLAGWETLVYALSLGGLGFLNTWDFPIYLGLVAASYGLARWRSDDRSIIGPAVRGATAVFFVLLIVGVLLYLPFWIGLQSQASGILPNLFNATRPSQFFVMFGPLLVVCGAVLAAQATRAGVRPASAAKWTILVTLGAAAAVGVTLLLAVVVTWAGLTTSEGPLGYLSSWLRHEPIPGPGTVADLTPLVSDRLLRRPLQSWTALGLVSAIVTAWLTLRPRSGSAQSDDHESRRSRDEAGAEFAIALIAMGALLALTVEFMYLGDAFGTRMNTVFKFYFQTWILWAIGGAYGLARFTSRTLAARDRARTGSPRIATRVTGAVGLTAAWLLVASGLVYTALAIPARAGESGGTPTLDGAAHLAQRDPDDYAAIAWFNETVSGTPVILEAPGTSYGYEARVSAHTGLPTVLGWSGHEYQWRGSREEQAQREGDIEAIFSGTDTGEALRLLEEYEVKYVIVGALERSRYPASGLSKLASVLTPVFEAGSTSVYAR